MPDATTDANTPATPALDPIDALDAFFVEAERRVDVDGAAIVTRQCLHEMREHVTALRSARQDAKRLDWMENHPMVIPMSHDTRGWFVRDKRWGWEHSAPILREAIDAAITEEAGR